MKKLLILILVSLSLSACGKATTTTKEVKPVNSPLPKATAAPIATQTPAPIASPRVTKAPKEAVKAQVKQSQSKETATVTNQQKAQQKEEQKAPETPKNEAKDTVKLTIFGEKQMLSTTSVPMEGETVADLLKRVAEENGIKVKIRGKGKFAYIVSIGDLAEFDKGPESGWTYYINNEYQFTGAGNVFPKAGDLIQWKYKF